MQELVAVLIMALIAIVGAGSSFLVSWLNNKKSKLELQEMKDHIRALSSDKVKAYILCYHCKTKNYVDEYNTKFEEVKDNEWWN